MATSRSGPAPIVARKCGIDPGGELGPRDWCQPCKMGKHHLCWYPFRRGKTYRKRRRGRKGQ